MLTKIKNFLSWFYNSSPLFFALSAIILGFQLFTLLMYKLGVWLFTWPGFIILSIGFYMITWVYAVYKQDGFSYWWKQRPWR